MPELPEVETIKNTLISHVVPCLIKQVRVHYPYLRYPVNDNITNLNGSIIRNVIRVAKYLIIITDKGNVIMHFGMSGCLRFANQQSLTLGKHDHIHFRLANDRLLIFNDPRRFGLIKYIKGDYMNDALLRHLGIDPLTEYLQSKHLWKRLKNRQLSIKDCIMNQKIIAGIGNIYASEILFRAKIDPHKKACFLSQKELSDLINAIQAVLKAAIALGGTTIKDFQTLNGTPGFFKQKLAVYGRNNQPCPNCNDTIKAIQINQRKTYYCQTCQSKGEKS